MAIQKTSDATFTTDVLQSSLPVLVDVMAEWCQPCKQLTPILESLSEDFAGKVVFYKLDIDENTQTATNLQIQAVPTLILYKAGAIVSRQSGFVSKEKLSQWLESV